MKSSGLTGRAQVIVRTLCTLIPGPPNIFLTAVTNHTRVPQAMIWQKKKKKKKKKKHLFNKKTFKSTSFELPVHEKKRGTTAVGSEGGSSRVRNSRSPRHPI